MRSEQLESSTSPAEAMVTQANQVTTGQDDCVGEWKRKILNPGTGRYRRRMRTEYAIVPFMIPSHQTPVLIISSAWFRIHFTGLYRCG